jgi:hypothetical protein
MPGLLTQSAPTPSTPTAASSAPSTPAASKPQGTMDPLLAKIKEGIEAKMPPDQKDAMDQIVVAGLKILYSPSTHPIIQKVYDAVQQGGFQPTQIATGLLNLMGMIMKASGGTASLPALYPAGVVLLTYVLDDLEKTRGLHVTGPLVQQTESLMRGLFMKLKVQQDSTPSAPGGTPPVAPSPMPASPAAAPAGV